VYNADVARRVRALRAMSVDPGATDSERAAHKAKADALEQKYGKIEPPVSYPRVTSTAHREYDWEDHKANHSEAFGPTGRGKSHYYSQTNPNYTPPPADPKWGDRADYAAWIMSGMSFTTKMPDEDLDDIVEDGYLWAPDDDDLD
jgi:hypothetical protein